MYLLHRKKIDIYANISQSVSRSDGGSALRDDLYSPECQPCQLDEPQRQIPSEDLIIRTRPQEPDESSAQSDSAAAWN